MKFEWNCGVGPDLTSLMRMQSYARKPREPMGEAWFMSKKRKMFSYLANEELTELGTSQLTKPLHEIASGNSCFGPMREWHDWFHYLLPRLVPIAMEPGKGEIQEVLVSALMSEYPDGISGGPYQGFREDVLRTLGTVLMDGTKWRSGAPNLERILWSPPAPENSSWGWWRASGDLSSSLFLCLKYLQPEELRGWLVSVFRIDDPHWRAQVLVWLVGAERLLETPGEQPKDVFMQTPEVDWASSHVLEGNYTGDYSEPRIFMPFLPAENKAVFWQLIRELLSAPVLSAWMTSIEGIDYLALEAGHILPSVENLLGVA